MSVTFLTNEDKTVLEQSITQLSEEINNISDPPDVSAFITRSVNDLENYYRKDETYTCEEIDGRISAIPKFTISVVSSLPTVDISETTIYLLRDGVDGNMYTEHIYVGGTWEILGSQLVDLTGYATQTWTLQQLAGYQPKGNYLTEHQDISGKLDANKLPEAVNTALAQAKASGEFDGVNGDNGLDGVSPTVSISKSGKVTTISITDKNGTKTATVNDGADGSAGSAGKDGTSVTVKSVSESTADGGSNVVTFSDGKTVTIKNGSKGSTGADGKAPVKGVDYFTPAEQEAIVQQVIAALGTPVFGRVDAENNIILTGALAEGTYTLKYEDAEGNVMEIGTLDNEHAPAYVNQIPISTDTDGSIYNGTGWKTGYRVSSSGTIKDLTGYEMTGFIPFKKGDVLRGNEGIIGLISSGGDASLTGYNVIALYDSNKTFIKTVGLGANYTAPDGVTLEADDSFVFDSSVNTDVTDAVAYVRVTTMNITATSIITVNQEIK